MKRKDKENTQSKDPKMQREELLNDLTKDLNKGKVKRLSLRESVYAKYCGIKDGKDGIPKLNEEGEWKSPFLDKEYDSYQECCSRIWGKVQIQLDEYHIACNSLVDDLCRLNQKLNESKEEIKNEVIDPKALTVRESGEKDFSEDEVRTRRSRQLKQRSAKKRAAVAAIEAQIVSTYKELSYKHNAIVESTNTARLACERIMNHSRQLADVYWRSAYRYHPERNEMPVSVRPFGICDAEKLYLEEHEEHDCKTVEILKRYEKKVMELENKLDTPKEVA